MNSMIWAVITFVLIPAIIVEALAVALWYACSWPSSQVLGPALVRGPAKAKQLALTFDDGPLPPYTEQILDILQESGVRATFFVCGRNAEQHPDLMRRIQSAGHTIGNHMWSHPYLYFMNRGKIAEEIDRTQKVIREITGQAPKLFRPPYGGRWFGLYPVLRERKMKLVQWSVNPLDWKLDAKDIIASVRYGWCPGAVILLHDGQLATGGYLQQLLRKGTASDDGVRSSTDRSQTVEALPKIIAEARDAGFEFVSVEDFLSA